MKKSFVVTGMHCLSCEMLITDSLEDLEGVKKATASFKDGIVEVECDASVSDDQIISVIKNEGYGV